MKSVRNRGYSGESSLSLAEVEDRERMMAVVMEQPHRVGVSGFHSDAWMASALGRLCRAKWPNDLARDYWNAGERYAQLIDEERISRGFSPRQCAGVQTGGSGLSLQEQLDRRLEAAERLRGAEDAMREVDNLAVAAVRLVAWDDLDIAERLHGRAWNALYKLSVYFERLDKPVPVR